MFNQVKPLKKQYILKKKNKKTWLFILPTDSIQGSEHIVKSFANFICQKGDFCRVIILTKKKSKGWCDFEKKMDISYLPFSHYFFGALALIPYLGIKNYGDVNFTFSSQTIINGTIGFAKRLKLIKAKVILRESNSIFHLLRGYKLNVYSFFYSLGYKSSSLVITQTDFMKAQLTKAIPKLSGHLNLKTIPNPFNFEDIRQRSGNIDPKFKNKKFLVAAGRLAHAKGFDLLINAFDRIHKQFPDIELIILGEGSDRESLRKQVSTLGHEDRIHMPGYVKNVYVYFSLAEACVLSSRIEGFPNVLLQMMSQNTAIVATLSAGGIEEIPGICTCEPENVDRLTHCIQEVINNDTSKNRQLFDSFLKLRTLNAFYAGVIEYVEKSRI